MCFKRNIIAYVMLMTVSDLLISVSGAPIAGGEPIPEDDVTFSFAVSTQYREYNESTKLEDYTHFCGGVLLQVFNKTAYVITASHCMGNVKDENISVVFGAKNLKNYDGQRFKNVSVHKKSYDRYTFAGDICIIKVYFDDCDKPRLSPIRVIIDEITAQNDACYIFGYGSETISGSPTLDLRLAPVKIISQESCLSELGPWNAPENNSGMFCAVGEYPDVDACPGDSGSGLKCIHNGILAIVGITSYRLDCGVVGMPGVYTTAAHDSNIEFIYNVISGNNTTTKQ